MRILLLTDTIHTGGAETFVLRLAEGLKKNGHDAYIYLTHPVQNAELAELIAPNVSLSVAPIKHIKKIKKLDSLLYLLNIEFSLSQFLFVRALRKYLIKNNIEIIHSHLFTSDMIAIEASRYMGIPVVTTMHGDYLLYSRSAQALKVSRILDFNKKLSKVLSCLAGIVCITEEQEQQIVDLCRNYSDNPEVLKIYNGYSIAKKSNHISKSSLNIPEESFIVGMVARGIQEKGWFELIEGFLQVNIEGSYLVLVGDGPFLQKIKQKYIKNNSIIFVGAVSNPIEYIRLFDLACLPSYFESESLPTVIIEYLFCHKPVLATRKGEIPLMLKADSNEASGVLIDIDNTDNMIIAIRDKIKLIFADNELYYKLVANTYAAASVFDMESCVMKYEDFYKRCLEK